MKKMKLVLSLEVNEIVDPGKFPEIISDRLKNSIYMKVKSIEPFRNRCLIVVRNGVAEYVCDQDVDVELFDFDSYESSPDETSPPSLRFADLAEAMGVPLLKD